jgi:hypothetical protein
MGKIWQSPQAEICGLLALAETDPELVSGRALFLLTEAGTAKPSEIVPLAQRCYALSVRSRGHAQEAIEWFQKSVESALAGGIPLDSRLFTFNACLHFGDGR